MGTRDDWFRSPLWGPEDQEFFEAKLARARPYNRPQYLRIKGLALADANDPVARLGARELFERVIALDDGFQATAAQTHLGEWFAQREDPVRAAQLWRATLSEQQRSRGRVDMSTALKLTELVVSEGWSADYGEAVDLLERAANDSFLLRDQRWRYLVALARIYSRTGQRAQARETAQHALDLLAITEPEFPRHPDLGDIHTDSTTIDEIRTLATAGPQVTTPRSRRFPWPRRKP